MAFDLESLLGALSEDAPCGADLEYDVAYLELEAAGAGKPEQQYGPTVIPGKPPDWPGVHEKAAALATRTRDLRVAMWLLRSAAHLRGWAGAVDGLQLLQGLLSRHWAHVHPQLDAASAHHPLGRLSALGPLTPQEFPYPGPPLVMIELRQAALANQRNSLLVREIELGMAAAEALPGELVPTEVGVVQALKAQLAQQPELAASMQAGLDALDGIGAALAQHLSASEAPDLLPLRKLLAAVARAAQLATGNGAMAAAPGAEMRATLGAGQSSGPSTELGAQGPATVPLAAAAIANREDVIRTLDQLCEWIELHEPTNPTPLLLRRAQRLMNKNFMDIIRDIAPDGFDQVARLAGRDGSE